MKAKTQIALAALMAATLGLDAENIPTLRELTNAHDYFEQEVGEDFILADEIWQFS